MSDKMPEKTFIAKPGTSVYSESGGQFTIVIPSPRCFVDAHSHIENGACAPLPLIWDKSILVRYMERKEIDDMATKGAWGLLFKVLKGQAGPIQVKSTSEIGDCLVSFVDETFDSKSEIGQSDLYRNSDVLACTILMMMDMEYAHIAGYNGQTIYHEDEQLWYYYLRESGKAPENKGKKLYLFEENQKTFSKWWKQLFETIQAVKTNPFRIIPMYHFDPRRWNYSKTTPLDPNYKKGPWHHPLDKVVSKTNKGLYIGIKMYPSLGYKPLDERLPYLHSLKDGDCFYARCMRDGIPILTHCSPGGMTTHELLHYKQYDEEKPVYSSQLQRSLHSSDTPPDAASTSWDHECKAIKYFYDNYVHPRAWREVLKKYKNLKLCLAHFGGELFPSGAQNDWIKEIIDLIDEFPNVYTDFSCWSFGKSKDVFSGLLLNKKYDFLKDRILFGTDWYMTLVALWGKGYKNYCEDFWEFFEGFPGGKDLWIRFSFLNPFEFYGFNDKAIIDNLNNALKDVKADAAKRETNYQLLCRLQKEYENQRKRLDKYKKA